MTVTHRARSRDPKAKEISTQAARVKYLVRRDSEDGRSTRRVVVRDAAHQERAPSDAISATEEARARSPAHRGRHLKVRAGKPAWTSGARLGAGAKSGQMWPLGGAEETEVVTSTAVRRCLRSPIPRGRVTSTNQRQISPERSPSKLSNPDPTPGRVTAARPSDRMTSRVTSSACPQGELQLAPTSRPEVS